MEQNFQKQYDLVPPSAQTPPLPPEKPKRGIPTWLGALIIVIVSVLLFGGIFAYQRSIPEPQTPVVNIKPNPTVGWLTYVNQKYGYEIKYPADWVYDFDFRNYVNNGDGSAYFCPPELQTEKGNGFDPDKKGCKAKNSNGGSVWTLAPIDLSQCELRDPEDLQKCDSPNLGTDKEGNYGYGLSILDVKYQDIYDKMLATFKFVDQTAGWTTYANSQYGFEIKYPDDFTNIDDLTPDQKNSLITYMGVCLVGNNARIKPNQTGFCYTGSEKSDGFATASFNMTVDTALSQQICQSIRTGPARDITQQTSINGINFYQDKIDNAGVGHYVTGSSYRTYYKNACYQIDLNIESNRGISEKGLNADFSATMDAKLKSMLATFKFTK